jgi:RecB family exonuclease
MKDETTIPLSLFETTTLEPPLAPLKDRLRSVEWSFSRRNTFEQCPQKYYLDYYGGSKRHALAETEKPLIRQLKLRQNRYARTGEIVHSAIANYFRLAQKGTIQSAKSLVQWAQRLLAEDLAASRTARVSASPSGASSGPLLEFSNDPKNAETLYEDAGQRMSAALQNFAVHPRYEKIRNAGRSTGADVERMFKLKNLPCRVTGIVDFAVRASEKPAIVDWKSGKPSQSEDDSLQLTAYALWGAQHFGGPPEKIAIYKAFLGSGSLVAFPLTQASVEKGKRRILQDVERMIEMHDYGAQGRRRTFTPCAQSRVCLLCPYLPICPEGKESQHA